MIKKIADLVNDKVLTEISDVKDHSDKSGMRIQIDLKREAIPQVVLNKLFKHTALQTTFGYNAVALVDGVPRTLSLLELVRHYLDYQREVVIRRSKYELRRAVERAHVLEGYLIALDNLDEVIALIRGADDTDDGAHGSDRALRAVRDPGPGDPRSPAARAHGSRAQADRGRVRRPPGADRGAPRDPRRPGPHRRRDPRGAARDQADLRPHRRAAHRDHRRARTELELEDMIAEEDMVIAITKSGYIKRLPVTAYREQRRGGIGVMGMDLKDEDYIEHLVRRLDARLHPLLHDRRQGLPAEGARAAARLAPVEGSRDRQPASVSPGRARPRRDRDAQLRGGEVPASSRRRRASSRRRSSRSTTRR